MIDKKMLVEMTVHNRIECTKLTLESLITNLAFTYNYQDYKVQVVDDYSTMENNQILTAEIANYKKQGFDIELKRNKLNFGDTHSRREFLKEHISLPGSTLVLFIDNDILFKSKEVLANLTSFYENIPLTSDKKQFIGGTIYSDEILHLHSKIGVSYQQENAPCFYNIYEIIKPGVGSAFSLGKKAFFDDVKYIARECDWDWTPRAMRYGYKFYYFREENGVQIIGHIPDILNLSAQDKEQRLRCWYSHQIGKGNQCGDLYPEEIPILREWCNLK